MKITVRRTVEYDLDKLTIAFPEKCLRLDCEDNDDADALRDFFAPMMYMGSVCMDINLETGKIADAPASAGLNVFAKVSDEGVYILRQGNWSAAGRRNDYVPSCLPNGGGDYLDFNVSPDGVIVEGIRDIDPSEFDWATQ